LKSGGRALFFCCESTSSTTTATTTTTTATTTTATTTTATATTTVTTTTGTTITATTTASCEGPDALLCKYVTTDMCAADTQIRRGCPVKCCMATSTTTTSETTTTATTTTVTTATTTTSTCIDSEENLRLNFGAESFWVADANIGLEPLASCAEAVEWCQEEAGPGPSSSAPDAFKGPLGPMLYLIVRQNCRASCKGC